MVEWYQLTEHGVWAHTALAEANDALHLAELGLTMTLAEVYEEAGVAPMKLVNEAGLPPLPPTAAQSEQQM